MVIQVDVALLYRWKGVESAASKVSRGAKQHGGMLEALKLAFGKAKTKKGRPIRRLSPAVNPAQLNGGGRLANS